MSAEPWSSKPSLSLGWSLGVANDSMHVMQEEYEAGFRVRDKLWAIVGYPRGSAERDYSDYPGPSPLAQ